MASCRATVLAGATAPVALPHRFCQSPLTLPESIHPAGLRVCTHLVLWARCWVTSPTGEVLLAASALGRGPDWGSVTRPPNNTSWIKASTALRASALEKMLGGTRRLHNTQAAPHGSSPAADRPPRPGNGSLPACPAALRDPACLSSSRRRGQTATAELKRALKQPLPP